MSWDSSTAPSGGATSYSLLRPAESFISISATFPQPFRSRRLDNCCSSHCIYSYSSHSSTRYICGSALYFPGLIAFGNFLAGDVLFATTFVLGLVPLLRSESDAPRTSTTASAGNRHSRHAALARQIQLLSVVAGLAVGCLCTSALRNRLILVGAAIVAAFLLWLIAGQSLIAIPDYLRTLGTLSSPVQACNAPSGNWVDAVGFATLLTRLVRPLRIASDSTTLRNRFALAMMMIVTMLLAFRAALRVSMKLTCSSSIRCCYC